MSSGFQPSGSSDHPSRETEQQPDDASRNLNQELLEKVLQVTQSLGIGDEPLGTEELRTLTAVARRRQGEPLSVETVTELVQTVLRLRFRALADPPDHWERMTRRIAETMFDDPQTLPRIQLLWTLLCEAAQ